MQSINLINPRNDKEAIRQLIGISTSDIGVSEFGYSIPLEYAKANNVEKLNSAGFKIVRIEDDFIIVNNDEKFL